MKNELSSYPAEELTRLGKMCKACPWLIYPVDWYITVLWFVMDMKEQVRNYRKESAYQKHLSEASKSPEVQAALKECEPGKPLSEK